MLRELAELTGLSARVTTRLWLVRSWTISSTSAATALGAATPAWPRSRHCSASPRCAIPNTPHLIARGLAALPPKRCDRAVVSFLNVRRISVRSSAAASCRCLTAFGLSPNARAPVTNEIDRNTSGPLATALRTPWLLSLTTAALISANPTPPANSPPAQPSMKSRDLLFHLDQHRKIPALAQAQIRKALDDGSVDQAAAVLSADPPALVHLTALASHRGVVQLAAAIAEVCRGLGVPLVIDAAVNRPHRLWWWVPMRSTRPRASGWPARAASVSSRSGPRWRSGCDRSCRRRTGICR